MAGLFQPKRVQVPGLLSDEGLSVALKNLSDTTKAGAEAAPPNTSAVDAANQITTEALKPQPTVKTAAPRVPGVELSAGAAPTPNNSNGITDYFASTAIGQLGAQIAQAGTLTPEQGEADRAERAAQAGAEAEIATGELADKTKLLSADEREAIGLPPLTPEDTMRLSSSIAQEQQIVKDKQERAKFIAEGPPTQQAEWLNIAQVSTRSAIQMGVGTLRYPADIWDTLGAVAAGTDEVKKSEVSLYLDNVDKALTAMMPGDKTRSKDFTTKLAAGAGSMVGFMVTGWAGRAVGLPAWLTTGTLGAAVEGDSLYQEADTFGATATQKLIALFAGSGLGLTEAVPIDRAFMRADTASGGMIRNLLANTTSTSLEEFIQEASQSLGEDIIAKYGAGYDPKREISVDKALENGLIGAIVGGTVGGATTLLSNGQPVEHLTQDEAKITETVDAALAEEQSRFASIIGDEAVDGEGALAAPAPVPSEGAPAGSQAAPTGPDPVRGDAVQQIVENQAAFHGTPHKFDKFSMEKIGTGEGAQAFGHGLYFAGNRDVAEHYRTMLADVKVALAGVGELDLADPMKDPSLAAVIYGEDTFQGAVVASNVIRTLGRDLATGKTLDAAIDLQERYIASWGRDQELASKALNFLRANANVSSSGALYQVDIPDDAELLDWDAPLSEQPEAAKKAIAQVAAQTGATIDDAMTGQAVYRAIAGAGAGSMTRDQLNDWYEDKVGYRPDADAGKELPIAELRSLVGEMMGFNGGDAAASKALLAAGVPGLRYLDAGSRTQGDGTRNYVIFDDNRIAITDVEQQVSPAQARALTTPVELPTDPVFAQAVAAVPGAEITADGLLIDLVRFQKPEQEGATSVRTGVFYLPVGSSNARHYKTGGQPGQWYGGPKKVEGKTLIRKPLFVKGATGGKAPEAAYDALMGKGAADKLTTAARSAATAPRDIREEVVDQFLTDNGADASMAWEIMQNSQVGNQLVYALKENVIAHAVRNAGYDAVVGYSKGKAGPFISEVFDVREIDYPVPGGEAALHPMFEQQVANPVERVQLEPTETAPLPGATTSPNPDVVKAARAYMAAAGLPTRRQRDFVQPNPARSNRIAQAYADMKHEPADPAVLSSYQALVEEVQAQYVFASAAGDLPPAENVPVYPPDHPLAAVADQFWALHRFFGQGLEGASDPENMWQAHARLFSADALPAFTAETRGAAAFTERWGEPAERKVGQLPSWTWQEGVDDTTAYAISAPVELRPITDAQLDAELPYLKQDEILAADPDYAALLTEWQRLTDAIQEQVTDPDNANIKRLKLTPDEARSLYARRDPIDAEIRAKQAAAKEQAAQRRLDRAARREQQPEAQFAAAAQAAVSASPYGAVTKVYSPAKYAKMRTFLSPDGSSGFALDGEKIVSLFGASPTQLRKIADTAIANGGRTFEGFDTGLPEMMASLGFRETGRKPWVEAYAPKDWPAALGKPDLVSMEWSGDIEQSVAAYATKTDAFANWFGDSVIKTKGEPLVVYHGTNAPDFSAFDARAAGSGTLGADTKGAFFFTTSADVAEDFAGYQYVATAEGEVERAYIPGARIMPVYLKIEDPDVWEMSGASYSESFVKQAIKDAKKRGADGVVFKNYRDGSVSTVGVPKLSHIFVAFKPTQIKSAIGNRGTFDPADPNIDRMTGTATARNPYLAEPTRPTRGIPTPSPDPGNQEDVRLSAISRNFVTILGLTARHGRLAARDSNVMGEYNRRTAAIRLRTWTDFSTLVHEGGHALNDSMAAPLNEFVRRNSGEINKASKLYAGDLSNATPETVRREGFAEFFRAYVTNPSFAQNRWPAMTADFEATLRANDPKILDGLNSISAQFAAWVQLPSRQLIRNMVVDGRRESGIDAAVKELRDQGFKGWMSEYARRATGVMINKYVSVAELEAQLLNLGEANRGAPIELQRSESPTAILRLARNSGSRAQVQITDGVIGYRSTQSTSRGLREALMTALGVPPDTTPASLDQALMKDFDAYLVARRAFDEYRRFEAGEIERPPIGAQKGDVVRTIKEYEQSQPQFAPAAAIVHEYGMAMWQKRYDAGLMDKETYEEGLQRQFYAPLQRDVSDKQGTGADSIGFGSSVLTKGPRFRGSDRDIISPMTVLMQMTFALEKQIAENDAKRALAVLADRAGQAGALVERIPASQLIGQSFSVQQVAARLTADSGLTAADASDLMTILAGSIEKGDLMTLFRSEQAGTQGENVIFFWENGKIAAIRLNDSSLASDVVNTMNAVGRENMDVMLEAVAATSTVFRTAITSWPDFLLVNYIRDQFSAWILGGTNYIPFATGFQGITDEIRQKQWAKSYNAAGGTLGGMTVASLHRTRVDRDINALRAKGYTANVFGDANGGWSNVPGVIKGLGRLTALTETGTRLGLYRGAYDRAIRDGLSEYDASVEAAYIATDYIDFGLNGSKMLTARRLIPFLNAQLQGLYKMYRTLGGDEVARRKGLRFALGAYFKNINSLPLSRLEQQQLRTGRAAWLKMMSLGLIGAALWAIFRDDPDYQEAGEYLRTTGWVIPTGDGKIFYIPKPFELALISNAVERGLELATGDTTAIDRFKRGVAFALTPPTAPPAIQSVVEIAANYDFFTGRQIVPDHMQALAPQLQYDNYTSSIAKWVGGATGQSPLVVDHILSGMGASAYRDISTMLNAADPSRPMPDETELPILRRFVRDVRKGSASAQDFWAQASNTSGKLERAKATYKQYSEMGNEPAANRFLDSLPADERAYAVLMTDFKPEEKRLNPFYRARQVTSIVSGMRRENASELGLGDTTREALPGEGPLTFQLARGLRTQVDDILSEIARREVRNTLIATGQPGWQDKEVLPLEPTLDMLLAVSPDAYDEYNRRRVKAKVYDAQAVYDYWPEVRDRLVSDGPDAILSDAVAVAGVVF